MGIFCVSRELIFLVDHEQENGHFGGSSWTPDKNDKTFMEWNCWAHRLPEFIGVVFLALNLPS